MTAFFKNKLKRKNFYYWFENTYLIYQPNMHTNWAKLLLVSLQSIASQYDKKLYYSEIFFIKI